MFITANLASAYYHTCTLHLFRPIIRFDLVNSSVQPGDVCRNAATEITKIMNCYRRRFTLRTHAFLLDYSLLSAATVHVIEIPTKGTAHAKFTLANRCALHNISQILQDLKDMSANHIYAVRAIKIIRGLAERNGKLLPDDHSSNLDISAPAYTSSMFSTTAKTTVSPVPYSSKASADNLRHQEGHQYGIQIPEDNGKSNYGSALYQSPALPAQPSLNSSLDHSHSNSATQRGQAFIPPLLQTSESPLARTQSESVTKAERPPNMFWTPFEGQCLPLYGHNINVSPMDLSSMLGTVDPWEQFNRDGFRVSDTWGQETFHSVERLESPTDQPNSISDHSRNVGGEHLQQHALTEVNMVMAPPADGQSSSGMTAVTSHEDGYQQEWWAPR
jgi:hypothetical protein